jgi:hypothetical protein
MPHRGMVIEPCFDQSFPKLLALTGCPWQSNLLFPVAGFIPPKGAKQ